MPRLRDLAAYAEDGGRVHDDSGWDAARGMVLAGCAIALLAGVAAAVAEPVGGALLGRPPAAQTIRRDVAAAPIASVHAAYTQASHTGLNRPPSPAEIRLQQFSRLARGISRGLWGVAATGAALACLGLAMRSSRPAVRDDGR